MLINRIEFRRLTRSLQNNPLFNFKNSCVAFAVCFGSLFIYTMKHRSISFFAEYISILFRIHPAASVFCLIITKYSNPEPLEAMPWTAQAFSRQLDLVKGRGFSDHPHCCPPWTSRSFYVSGLISACLVLFHHLVFEIHLWEGHLPLTPAEASNCTKSGLTDRSACPMPGKEPPPYPMHKGTCMRYPCLSWYSLLATSRYTALLFCLTSLNSLQEDISPISLHKAWFSGYYG